MSDRSIEDAVARALGEAGRGAAPLRWQRLSWPGIEALRELGCRTAILPCGALEQHGPHLPLDTDVAIATGVADYASAVTGVPVLPCLVYTSSMGHTDRWPGTLSSTPETLTRLVREICDWLVRSGWSRLVIVNAHYGNDAPLRCAVDWARTEHRGRMALGLSNVWDLGENARRFYLQDGEDIHANRAETSLMLALAPEEVGDAAGADDPDRTGGHVLSWPVADTSTNGVTGRPSEATAEEGRWALRELGEALASIVERASREEAPLGAGEDG